MILQSQRQSLRPVTTAHLAQTMTLMGLTAAELQQKDRIRPGFEPGAGISREALSAPPATAPWQTTSPAPSAAGLRG